MSQEKELRALARDLAAAADGVRDAVMSVGLTYNVVTIALADLLIDKGVASRFEIEKALSKGFDGLDERDYEDARHALTNLLTLLKRRRQSSN